MAHYLVSGHLGFIGQHLYRRLVLDGHQVMGIDLKEGSVSMFDPPDVRYLKPRDVEGFETIIHLAAQPKVPLSVAEPFFTNDHNLTGTLNILDCARQAGVKRVIFASSSSVYGNQKTLPLNENMPTNPMSPYALQKLAGEHYCRLFSELYGLQTVSLRFFNVYGEGMKTTDAYAACLAIFLEKKKHNQPLPVLGGKQTRDFTYVGDIVEGIVSCLYEYRIGKGEVINLGSGQNYSIDEIALAISEKVEHFPQRLGEPMNTKADNSKARRLLSWKPTVNIIEWLQSQKS